MWTLQMSRYWKVINKFHFCFSCCRKYLGDEFDRTPMYNINQYPLVGLSLPKQTATICCCNALLITKGHKATGREEQRDLSKR